MSDKTISIPSTEIPKDVIEKFQRHVNRASAEYFAETNTISGTMLTALREVYQSGLSAREEVSKKWASMAGQSDGKIASAVQCLGQLELIFNDMVHNGFVDPNLQSVFKDTLSRTKELLENN